MLTWNEKSEAINPAEVNQMATDWNDPDSLSLHVELRIDAAVQAAATALQLRLADINAQSGIQLAVAGAVKRLIDKGQHPTAVRVRDELQDMQGEAAIYAEKVAYAGRVEDRAAENMKFRRSLYIGLVASRIQEIEARAPVAQGDEAKYLAKEHRALIRWLQEPWCHPDELTDDSGYFNQLAAELRSLDPICDEPHGTEADADTALPVD